MSADARLDRLFMVVTFVVSGEILRRIGWERNDKGESEEFVRAGCKIKVKSGGQGLP